MQIKHFLLIIHKMYLTKIQEMFSLSEQLIEVSPAYCNWGNFSIWGIKYKVPSLRISIFRVHGIFKRDFNLLLWTFRL